MNKTTLIIHANKTGEARTSDRAIHLASFVFVVNKDKKTFFIHKQRHNIFKDTGGIEVENLPVYLKQIKNFCKERPQINKKETNTAALNSLKSQGWNVNVTHYRRLNDGAYFPEELEKNGQIVKDSVYRQSIQGFARKSDFWREEISHFGGATEIILERGEEKIVVRADCYVKDRFNRKLGVRAALDKLQKLYNIS